MIIGTNFFDAYLIADSLNKIEQLRTETAYGLYNEEKVKSNKLSEALGSVSQRLYEALEGKGYSEFTTYLIAVLGASVTGLVTYLIMK